MSNQSKEMFFSLFMVVSSVGLNVYSKIKQCHPNRYRTKLYISGKRKETNGVKLSKNQ